MEGKSGFDVAAYLREYCQMPFMFLSAFSDDDTVAQVKALGAVDYLVKPLDIRQIVPAVEAAFAHIDARRAPAAPAPAAEPRTASRRRVAGARGGDGGRRADAPLFARPRRGAGAPAAAWPPANSAAWPTRPSGCCRRSNCCRAPAD